MAPPRQYTNEAMILALVETKGMVYLAARRLGCDAKTIRKRMRRSGEVRRTFLALRGEFVDTAELKLYQAVLDGNWRAVRYVLSTLGNRRGYKTNKQLELRGTGPNGEVEIVVKKYGPGVGKPGRDGNGRAEARHR
jgi:hypothetical protein